MREDQKNLFLAMGLSLLVIVGWQYFYAGPKLERARETVAQTENKTAPVAPSAANNATPGAVPQTPPGVTTAPTAEPAAAMTRAAALAESKRIPINTGSLGGSIALKGGRLDDLDLKNYRETVDPTSPNITLLSPAGSPEPYYVDTGFVSQPTAPVATPKADTSWTTDATQLTPGKPVVLTWDNGAGAIFHREISVDDQYMFTFKDSVENKSGAPLTLFPYALTARRGKPVTSGYAVLHEGYLGVIGSSRVQEITYDGIEKETSATRILDGVGGWLGFTDKYWAVAVIPQQDKQFKGRFSSTGTAVKTYQSDLLEDAVTVAPGASADTTTNIFAGAKVTRVIDAYQTSLGIKNFDLMIDWGWFYFITKPLFWLIDFIFKYVGNFGVAILIVTVLVKGAFFPLANKSYMSMAKMKAIQPQVNSLKEKYPDDRQKQQQEMMELYKREGVNPVAGCLPIAIQIPVFFALYKVIFITIEMRQAPFFGWIKDLSSPDPTNVFNLFGLIPFDPTQLPLFGHFLALGVWPIIMGVSMFVQMKMNPEPADPVQKQMFTWMPLIFTFMLGAFPAGLVIYWTWNNTLSVLQQGLILKKAGVKIELFDNLKKMLGRGATT
jgi:YidC/Oxa1 family membrane protein insertase